MPLNAGRSSSDDEPLHRMNASDASTPRRSDADVDARMHEKRLEQVPDMLAMGHLVEAGLAITGTPPPVETVKLPKRRPGRPKGRNYDKVTVSLDHDLVAQIDEIADREQTSRSSAMRRLIRAAVDARTA